MPRKPSIAVDLLAAVWVIFVAVMFYGGYFLPDPIGIATGWLGCPIYLVFLILAVALVVVNRLAASKSKAPE